MEGQSVSRGEGGGGGGGRVSRGKGVVRGRGTRRSVRGGRRSVRGGKEVGSDARRGTRDDRRAVVEGDASHNDLRNYHQGGEEEEEEMEVNHNIDTTGSRLEAKIPDTEKEMNDYLKSIYYDPKHAAGYTGAATVYKAVKSERKYRITLKQIKTWLASQDAYATFKTARKRFPRPKVIVSSKDQMWDCDCLSMKYHIDDNKGYGYILVCVDVFTRFLYTRPLVALQGILVKEAYEDIFILNETPKTIRTDHGSEFVNKITKQFFLSKNIKHYLTNNEIKTSHGERVIQTLRMRIARMFRARNNFNWIDHLQALTDAYNNSKHRAINSTPTEAMCATEKSELWHWQYKRNDSVTKTGPNLPYEFQVGDRARMSFLRQSFHRAYDHSWSKMIYTITHRRMHQGFQKYQIKTWDNEEITGEFYRQELQKVTVKSDDEITYEVEAELKRRTVGPKNNKRTEVLVKWLGWSKRFNTWIPESQLSDL